MDSPGIESKGLLRGTRPVTASVVLAVLRASATDGMFLAIFFGFILMLLYTLADAHKAWEAAHALAMNVCMAVLCFAFLPAVLPFVRHPCRHTWVHATAQQRAGWLVGLVGDYTLLLGTVAFAVLGVFLFLAPTAPVYMLTLLVVECIGCWGFLLSSLSYAASWVLGSPSEPQAGEQEKASKSEDEGQAPFTLHVPMPGTLPQPDPVPSQEHEGQHQGETAQAWARLLSIAQLEWWGHALNIGGSLVYVLASTSATLLVLSPAATVPMAGEQARLRQGMAQSFVIGDILWTLDAAVFLGMWAREAIRAECIKRASVLPQGEEQEGCG